MPVTTSTAESAENLRRSVYCHGVKEFMTTPWSMPIEVKVVPLVHKSHEVFVAGWRGHAAVGLERHRERRDVGRRRGRIEDRAHGAVSCGPQETGADRFLADDDPELVRTACRQWRQL